MRRGCQELGWPCQPRTRGTTRCYSSQSLDCSSQLSSIWNGGGSARADTVVVTVCTACKLTWALLKGHARTCGSNTGAEATWFARVTRSCTWCAAERAWGAWRATLVTIARYGRKGSRSARNAAGVCRRPGRRQISASRTRSRLRTALQAKVARPTGRFAERQGVVGRCSKVARRARVAAVKVGPRCLSRACLQHVLPGEADPVDERISLDGRPGCVA